MNKSFRDLEGHNGIIDAMPEFHRHRIVGNLWILGRIVSQDFFLAVNELAIFILVQTIDFPHRFGAISL